MKKIIIRKMRLLNFKGIRSLELQFDGEVTSIGGRNASGKTTVFDAFTWVLFNKDSRDREKFALKTLDADGVEIPKIPHEVTVWLEVDGEEMVLTRRCEEKWTKKRGSATHEYSGNTFERICNEVPLSEKEWQAKINAICPEETLKLITNPAYFASMPWERQREKLFTMAGGITNEEVAAGNAEFRQLLKDLKGRSIAEYRRVISSSKEVVKKEIADIPGRIDECSRKMTEDCDHDAVDAEVKAAQAEVATIDEQLADTTKILDEVAAARMKLVQQSQQIGISLAKMEAEAAAQVNKEWQDRLNARRDVQQDIDNATRTNNAYAERAKALRKEVKAMAEERERLIAERDKVNSEQLTFTESDFICPTCGHHLEVEGIERKQQEMLERFTARKSEHLAAIAAKGQKVHQRLISEKQAEIEKLEGEGIRICNEIVNLNTKFARLPEPVKADPMMILSADEQYKSLKERKAQLDAEIAKPVEADDSQRSALLERKRTLTATINEGIGKMAAEAMNKANRERIEELETSLRAMSEELARLEGIEFTIAAFTKARIEAMQSKINGLFSTVQFVMYEQQINGGEREKCEAMVGGVPLSSVNNAGRINAGLDIINAICKFEGICAPIFVDNAESVNEIMHTDSQQIRLLVTEDSSLKLH